jgi:multiple sugar transport system substrate-binding protein
MQQRPLRGLALFTVLSLTVAACGGGGQTEAPGASTPAGSEPAGSQPAGSPAGSGDTGEFAPSGDIFAFGVNRAEADEIATERIEYFEELYPDVTLSVSESGFTAEGFLASLASDDPPDVVRMDRNLIPTYVARDTLMPLDECFERTGFDPTLYYESTMSEVTVDGQMYAVPEAMDTRNWLINTAAFEEADLNVEEFDFSDWDAIRAANEALVRRDGETLTRIGLDPKIPEFFALWAKANGVDLVSADGLTSQLEDPAVAEALQFTVDLINAQGGRDPFLSFRGTWDFFGAENQFATDKVGAHPMEQWYLNVIAESSPEAPITVKPFLDREGNPITLQGGSGLAITDVAPNPDGACAFVTAMAATEAWTRAVEERIRLSEEEGGINTGTFPANREANEIIFSDMIDVEALPETFGGAVRAVLDNQENAFAFPPSPANVTIFFGDTSIVATAVARVLDGEDAATVLAEADEEAQAAIDQALGQ